MQIAISHKALGHLVGSVGSTDTYMKLSSADAQAFLNLSGDYIYALLRGVIAREIIRIDIAASDFSTGSLSVARGQGGTTASAWASGTLIMGSTHADHYNSLIQRGEYRQIDYNPNEVLTPLYAGENVYQTGPAGCERWWKSYNAINPYWDLITGVACLTEEYQDIGWTYELLLAVAPGSLIATEAYINGSSSNINVAKQIAISHATTSEQIGAQYYLLGTWKVCRSWLVWDLSALSGVVNSATFRAWTSSWSTGWGSYGIVLVEGKTGWKGEGGGGGDMSSNYTTWYWPGPGLETNWGTTLMAPTLNKGTGSEQDVECAWVLNAAGLALINSKIGTANWLELLLVTERDANNSFGDTCNIWFWTPHHSNSDYHPSMTLGFA